MPKNAIILVFLGAVGVFSLTGFWLPHLLANENTLADEMRVMMDGERRGRGPRHEMRDRMMGRGLPPGIKPEALPEPNSTGARLLVHYCTQCHNLVSPVLHTPQEWPTVVSRMIDRMKRMSGRKGGRRGMMRRGRMKLHFPSNEKQQAVLDYLQRHGMKAAGPENLGPSDAPGFTLFQRTCSQCHALPDPGMHTPQEWRAVVERMRRNMNSMKRPVITDKERDVIVGYLSGQGG